MVYLYLLLLIIAWRFLFQQNVIINGLFGIYIISAISGILLMFLDPDNIIFQKTQYGPLFYLLLVLLLCFCGFSNFTFNVDKINRRKRNIIIFAEWVGWISIPVALLLLFNDFNVLRNVDLAVYRVEADYYSTGLFKGGLFLSLCIYLSELSFVPHFLFFYVLTLNDVSKGLKVRLLLGSFTFAFMTLMFAGRDGVVFWLMNSVIFYSLFKDYYSERVNRTIKRGGIIVSGLALIPFVAISAARFYLSGSTTISETLVPFLEYIGQGPYIFSQAFFVNYADIQGYDASSLTAGMAENLQLYLGYSFGTFVSTFVWQYGKLWTIALAFLFCLLSRKINTLHKRNNDIWSLFLIIMMFQIPYWGVFYYRYAINKIELVYLLFAFICLLKSARYK